MLEFESGRKKKGADLGCILIPRWSPCDYTSTSLSRSDNWTAHLWGRCWSGKSTDHTSIVFVCLYESMLLNYILLLLLNTRTENVSLHLGNACGTDVHCRDCSKSDTWAAGITKRILHSPWDGCKLLKL